MMGSAGAAQAGQGMQLSKLHEILGEAMPELPRSAVGRHRLVRALNQRFGKNFRSLPGVSDLVKQFDDEVSLEQRVQRLKNIKLKGR